jgi:hypothetical protein
MRDKQAYRGFAGCETAIGRLIAVRAVVLSGAREAV